MVLNVNWKWKRKRRGGVQSGEKKSSFKWDAVVEMEKIITITTWIDRGTVSWRNDTHILIRIEFFYYFKWYKYIPNDINLFQMTLFYYFLCTSSYYSKYIVFYNPQVVLLVLLVGISPWDRRVPTWNALRWRLLVRPTVAGEGYAQITLEICGVDQIRDVCMWVDQVKLTYFFI